MFVVRPIRLALTATLTFAGVVCFSQPWMAPAPVQKTAPSAPVDTIVTTADPAVPTVSDARVTVARDTLERDGSAPDVGDIPTVALAAYQRATTVATRVDESCGLSWTLLAAIGGVESDHGRYGGARLDADGVSHPAIRGVPLDGRKAVSKVADTDAGRVDGDKRWDRAVGPMQFLPSTWATLGVDADGDGVRSADDIDDAALGAAVFLCSAPGSLDTRQGRIVALHRYNPSTSYVAEVLALEHEYRTGRYAQPDVPVVVRAIGQLPTATSGGPGGSGRQQGHQQGPSGQGQQGGQHGQQGDQGDQGGQQGGQHGGQSGHDGNAYEPDHPHGGGGSHDPGDGPGTDPGGDPGGDPSDPPTPDGPQTFPTQPPTTEPTPVTAELTGTLAACGDETTPAWCLDDTVLDLGDADYLAAAALADFDADGTVETNAEELAGLEGTEVTLVVTEPEGGDLPQVLAIGNDDYVVTDDGTGPGR
ncbi:MAG: lytic transglycosylase domain-containing protein [Nocardioides sp.]|nr:lytic transglycosylase domain-containing protein [Nocardioidaceae bacterium]MCB8955877.1 lytic transglycosylase domain-containing protein [Nocardioides sp.]